MWQSAACGNPGKLRGDPTYVHNDLREPRRLRVLLVSEDARAKRQILSSARPTPTEVHPVSTIRAALASLAERTFDVVVIDRHLGDWVSAHTCRHLVSQAGGMPVVGLINEDCILDFQDGVAAGLTGVYYKDQIDDHLVRRLRQLARLPSMDASLLGADAAA